MWVERTGKYLLDHPLATAAWATALSITPFAAWLSMVLCGLITLQQGWRSGLVITVLASLPCTVLLAVGAVWPAWQTPLWHLVWLSWPLTSAQQHHGWVLFAYRVIASNVWVYLACLSLLGHWGWQRLLSSCALLGVAIVVSLHLLHADIIGYWTLQINLQIDHVLAQQNIATVGDMPERVRALAGTVAAYASGITVAVLLYSNLFNVFIARWWQARLHHPAGLRQELLNLRLGWLAAVMSAAVIYLAFVQQQLWAKDSLVFIVVSLIGFGLSTLHYLVQDLPQAWWMLLLFYAVVIVLPYVLVSVMLLAVVDTCVNLRSYRPQAG